ncbi:hypothetical protein BKA80DRAFT_272578 [Phyllosticta citrichinensis]
MPVALAASRLQVLESSGLHDVGNAHGSSTTDSFSSKTGEVITRGGDAMDPANGPDCNRKKVVASCHVVAQHVHGAIQHLCCVPPRLRTSCFFQHFHNPNLFNPTACALEE